MCQKAVEDKRNTLEYVLDHLKTQEMCERVFLEEFQLLKGFTHCSVTQKRMRDNEVLKIPILLEFNSTLLNNQQMCNEFVKKCPQSLMYVPNC